MRFLVITSEFRPPSYCPVSTLPTPRQSSFYLCNVYVVVTGVPERVRVSRREPLRVADLTYQSTLTVSQKKISVASMVEVDPTSYYYSIKDIISIPFKVTKLLFCDCHFWAGTGSESENAYSYAPRPRSSEGSYARTPNLKMSIQVKSLKLLFHLLTRFREQLWTYELSIY